MQSSRPQSREVNSSHIGVTQPQISLAVWFGTVKSIAIMGSQRRLFCPKTWDYSFVLLRLCFWPRQSFRKCSPNDVCVCVCVHARVYAWMHAYVCVCVCVCVCVYQQITWNSEILSFRFFWFCNYVFWSQFTVERWPQKVRNRQLWETHLRNHLLLAEFYSSKIYVEALTFGTAESDQI